MVKNLGLHRFPDLREDIRYCGSNPVPACDQRHSERVFHDDLGGLLDAVRKRVDREALFVPVEDKTVDRRVVLKPLQ